MGKLRSAKNLKSVLRLGASFAEDRYGGAAIIMAFATPIIIGGLAFGAEVGGWELTKRQVQNAADVAAYAAGTQVRSDEDDVDTLEGVAALVAEESGYKGGSDGVEVEYPPSTAPVASDGTDPNGDNSFVYVTLTQSTPRVFTKFFSSTGEVTFTSGALARVANGRPACVLALHPSAPGAISGGGSPDVTLSGCDIAANSISSTAVDTGTGNAANFTANCVSAVGGVDDGGNFTYTECSEAIENAGLTADPYKDVADASANCASYSNANQFTNNGNPSKPGVAGASAASPSYNCYTGVGALGRDVQLKSNAVYVLKDSHVRLNGGKDITGTNVMIFLTGDSSISIQGNSTMSLTPMLSGPYKGVAIMADRDDAIDMDLTGNSGVSIVGAVYAPNSGSNITFTGNNSGFTAGQCTQVIGGTVTFWGSAEFSTDCSQSGTTSIMTAQSIKIVG